MNKLFFTLCISGLLIGCAKSAQENLDTAVDTHIKSTTSGQAEDLCRNVFLTEFKKVGQGAVSTQLCEALNQRSDAELGICEDEIQAPEFSNLIAPCKSDLLNRLTKIVKSRNDGVQGSINDLAFKIPFEIQYRDLSHGYTAASGDVQKKQIILSFDDGPHPTLSKNVVAMLDKVGVKAHFMEVGSNVQNYPAVTQMIANHGNSIGNHSWDHSNFATLNFDDQLKQITDTNKAIFNAIGWVDPFFRYPYGSTTPEMNQYLKDHSIADFLWSIDSNDWKKINSDKTIRTNDQVIQETLAQLDQRGRGLVLFHDVHARTIELLPTFLIALYKRGYTVVMLQADNSQLRTNPLLK